MPIRQSSRVSEWSRFTIIGMPVSCEKFFATSAIFAAPIHLVSPGEDSMSMGERLATAAVTIALKVSRLPTLKAPIAKPSSWAFWSQSLAVILRYNLLLSAPLPFALTVLFRSSLQRVYSRGLLAGGKGIWRTKTLNGCERSYYQ